MTDPGHSAVRFLAGAMLACLTGCAGQAKNAEPTVEDPVITAIGNAATQIQRSWNEIAQVRKGVNGNEKAVDTFEGGGLPPGMEKTVRLNQWAGPIETLVATMASEAQYKFEIVGQRPAGVIVVYVDTGGEQRSVGYVLRDAGSQAGDRCGIVIRSHTRTVELVYPTPARG